MNTGSKGPAHDRQLLLEGAKRNAVLDLTEVQRYGIESWGDPDYVCIYGLRPSQWAAVYRRARVTSARLRARLRQSEHAEVPLFDLVRL